MAFGRRAGPIHLLLTDVVMPERNGRELAGEITTRRPHMRVLFMSAYTEDAIEHFGMLDPGTALIEKPFSPDDLANKVREVLGGGAASA
jgi:CheY-like chemotaxis protein